MATVLPLSSREEAGRLLADLLAPLCPEDNLLILALPRGGVPVGFEIAQALRAEFDVLLVRKLGAPSNPELALGAIAAGGIQVMNGDVAAWADVAPEVLSALMQSETQELQSRLELYRRHRPWPPIAGRTVVLVDDGIATGATMRAAIAAVRTQEPSRVVVAAPVAPPDTMATLMPLADATVCLATPEPFGAIARFYRDFPQVPDAEVISLLARAWQLPHGVARGSGLLNR